MLVQKYGVEVGGEDGKEDFDQIKPFHRFVLFAHDSIKFRKPMEPDIHFGDVRSYIHLRCQRWAIRQNFLDRTI